MTSIDRRAARRQMSVKVYRMGEEPGDDLSASTTAAERLAMVEELSKRMWALTGRATPSYSRSQMPIRVIRLA